MSERLSGPRLDRTRARLERAKVHQREFGRIWNEFLEGGEGEPYVPRVVVYPSGEGHIEVEAIDFPEVDLALEFGELLYQLRAALDSLVYEVAIHVSGQDPPPNADELEFPIRPSEASFKNAAGKLAPLADHHRIWIEDVQPYRAEYETDGMAFSAKVLNEINDLARKDRHRGLRVLASWGGNRNALVDVPAECTVEWLVVTDDGVLEDDAVVARFKIGNWKPGLEIQGNPNLTIDVTVAGAAPPIDDEDTLFRRTRSWITVVKLLIEGFENSLAGDPRSL